ncbi:MAG: alpha/beta hydrolase [Spirochaetales bacterium]|nr:alpha/beta hydrolase [Spirochaetales bacterium]
MESKTGLILLPGAGMSDWIWDRCKAQFLVKPIMITDRISNNNYLNRKKSKMLDCVSHIEQIIQEEKYVDYIIIGHSGSGPIAAKLAQSLKDKVKHVIYVAANIPKHGQTMIDSLPFLLRLINIIAIKKMIKKDSIPYKNMEKIIREKFCNTCTEEIIKNILQKEMKSEPLCAISEKMDWSSYAESKQTYFLLTKDNTLSIDRQKQMANNLNIQDFIEIDSDHLVMLSHPNEFASAVNKFF